MALRQQTGNETTVREEQSSTLKRRGILAAAGAVVAGIVARQASNPVAAGVDGDVVLGATSFAAATTTVGATLTTAPTFRAVNGFSGAADAKQDGMQGFTVGANTAGTFGRNNDLNGVGLWGEAPNGTGAFGDSGAGSGVAGASTSGAGVFGVSTSGIGVQASSTSNIAVYAASTSNTGVYGQTGGANQFGVLGVTTATNSFGLAGIANQDGCSAFSGGTTNANAFAAFFQGKVTVQGNFAVTGTKSAAIKHPKTGDYRLVYCVETPDSWLEDIDEGTLVGGKATVKFDPDFVALIHTDKYHVFLTPHDASNKGLAVTSRTPDGFTVQEQNGGTSNGTFSWRALGKRADVKGDRLAKADVMPKAKLDLNAPPAPKTPNIPKSRP